VPAAWQVDGKPASGMVSHSRASVLSFWEDPVELPPEERQPPWALARHCPNAGERFLREFNPLQQVALVIARGKVPSEEHKPERANLERWKMVGPQLIPSPLTCRPRPYVVCVEMAAHRELRGLCVPFGSIQR
jgi:hypothetical protein